jgi:4-hydroxy-tetrahydrodipicolinate reductase
MRLGLFGRGRLGSAIAQEAGDALAWQVGRTGSADSPVDVAIDASIADAVEAHLEWAIAAKTNLVIGVTGWRIPKLREHIGDQIGALVASNFSLTVALMERFSLIMGRFAQLDPNRDLYLMEHHHKLKVDAPSGTAKTLATALMKGCPRKHEWTIAGTAPLQAHQLSVGVIRSGAEFGTHSVGIDAPSEILELTHTARSRAPFAQGAIFAARWLQGRKGLFSMEDVARDVLDPLFDFGVHP